MKLLLNKPRVLLSSLLFITFAFGLSACSNSEKPKAKPKYKTIQTLNQQQKVESGTIIAVRDVAIPKERVNSYSNIGVVASSSGHGGIYGSIDLGTLSRLFKKDPTPQLAQEIIVKKRDGQTIAITQVSKEIFKKGENVNILLRDGKTILVK